MSVDCGIDTSIPRDECNWKSFQERDNNARSNHWIDLCCAMCMQTQVQFWMIFAVFTLIDDGRQFSFFSPPPSSSSFIQFGGFTSAEEWITVCWMQTSQFRRRQQQQQQQQKNSQFPFVSIFMTDAIVSDECSSVGCGTHSCPKSKKKNKIENRNVRHDAQAHCGPISIFVCAMRICLHLIHLISYILRVILRLFIVFCAKNTIKSHFIRTDNAWLGIHNASAGI